jgi:hypothetical protein
MAQTQAPRGTRFAPQNQSTEAQSEQLVYDTKAPGEAGASVAGAGGSPRTFDVGTFPVFPVLQNVTFPLGIDGVTFGWTTPGTAAAGLFDQLVAFFATPNENTCNYTLAPFYSGAVGSWRLNGITPNPGFVSWYGAPLQFLDSNSNIFTVPFQDPTTSAPLTKFGYEQTCFANTTNNYDSRTTPIRMANLMGVGTSDPRGWAFGVANTTPTGCPAGPAQAAYVHPQLTRQMLVNEANGTAAVPRNSYLKLQSLINDPVPPSFTDLGRNTTDATTQPPAYNCASPHPSFTKILTLTAGQGQWMRMVVASDASVANQTYMDISLEQDVNTGLDVPCSIGLYRSSGARVANDTARGTGTLYPVMTFGHGRRPGFGGIDRDGRDGDLTAGTYYIFVSGPEATYGSSGYAANAAASTAAGTVQLKVVSNTGPTNCALPAPIAPTAIDIGTLSLGQVVTRSDTVGFGQVNWFTFTTDFAIDTGANSGNFIDINNNGVVVGSTDMAIFKSNGTGLQAGFPYADNSSGGPVGAYNHAQLSIGGAANPRAPIGAGQPFAGQNGDTAAPGTYYLAVSLDTMSYSSVAGGFGFQARSNSGSSLTVQLNIRTPFPCNADYNRDGFLNLDDLGDFITDYYTCPPIPGGAQANAPTYTGQDVGYGAVCPDAPDAPAPYAVDAYRTKGFRVGYSSDGSNSCPLGAFDATQCPPFFPNLDNLGDYITYYYANVGVPPCA